MAVKASGPHYRGEQRKVLVIEVAQPGQIPDFLLHMLTGRPCPGPLGNATRIAVAASYLEHLVASLPHRSAAPGTTVCRPSRAQPMDLGTLFAFLAWPGPSQV